MCRVHHLLPLVLLTFGCAATHQPVLVTPPDTHHEAPPTLIRNVRVFTGLEDDLTEPVDVLLARGRVARVAHPGKLVPPEGTEVVDAEGLTLMPGLVDMNVRLGASDDTPPWAGAIRDPKLQAEALLYSGITTVVAVGHDADIEALQKEIADGRVAGPRMFRSSHSIVGTASLEPGPFGRFFRPRSARIASTPKDAARAARRDLEYLRSDFVKVDFGGEPGLSRKALEAVVAEARMYERSVYVDAQRPEDAAEAAEAGATLLLHTPWTSRLTNEQADAIALSGAPVVTTARLWAAMGERMSGTPSASPLEGEVLRTGTGAPGAGGAAAAGPLEDTKELASSYDATTRENLAVLRELGVPLLAGSGSGLPGLVHGAALHQELQALVALGFPPAEVLKMATSYPVRILAPRAAFGVIGLGAYADLLLVDGNPVEDISAVGRIVAVWQAGRKIDRRIPAAPVEAH
ncbi:amidohydrolase [Vulgatibacter incomptus]|uniref:Amidohydrolase n=2 Tax=Vulgatibacter incomptus TaxID=1391653 RepID=A0A0K1PIN1_9BACT|nr:amidohydrolase [Vulgatibacter incomptus]